MTSPGSSVKALEQKATRKGTLKIRSAVVPSCIRDLVAGDQRRTRGAEGVQRLGAHELLVGELQIPCADVVDAGVAEHMIERRLLGHAPRRAPDGHPPPRF